MSTVLQLTAAPEFTSLKDIRSLLGQNLSINIPQGEITPEGIQLILDYLKEKYPGVELPCPKGTTFFQWKWLDRKEGTLPKRTAKWLKKRLKTNADQQVIAHVGNLARQNSDDTQSYYFRIVDKFDWEAYQFGKEGGGCWWGIDGTSSYRGKPQLNSYADKFQKNDGLAVQFFRSDNYSYENGIGRLWVFVEPDARFAATFNGYWDNEGATLRLTRVLASYLGLSYKKCETLYTDISVYINGDQGYFIGEEQALNFLKDKSYRIPRKTVYKPCSLCERSFEQEIVDRYEGLCYPCFQASRKVCPNCYLRKDSRQFRKVRTNDGLLEWCSGCVSLCSETCQGCHDARISIYFDYPGCVKVEGVYMCAKCTMSSRKCQDCGKRTLNTDAMDDPLCLSCEDQFEEDIRIEKEPGDLFDIKVAVSNAMGIAVAESNAAMRRLQRTLERRTAQRELENEDADIPF